MADSDSTVATLLDELAALDAARRHELAEELRLAETFAGVPDGRHTAAVAGGT